MAGAPKDAAKVGATVEDLDEILKRARKLPDDDARRELRDRLRHRARECPDTDPDERRTFEHFADEIDKLITTPAKPVSHPSVDKDANLFRKMMKGGYYLERNDSKGEYHLESATPEDIKGDYLFEHMDEWIKPIINSDIPKPRKQGIFNDIYRWLCDYPLLKRDKLAVEVIKKINEREYSTREKYLLADIIEKNLAVTPIPRGAVAQNIKDENRPIGNRGHVDDTWGDSVDYSGARPHVTRRRTASDRKKIGGKDYDLDGTKLSQKRRNAVWPGAPKVRLLTEQESLARHEWAERMRERGFLPKPKKQIELPPPPADKFRDHSPEDWRAMARDDKALPDKRTNPRPASATEKQILQHASRAAESDTKPAVTPQEIKQQEEKAREAEEEAAENEPMEEWEWDGFNKDGTVRWRKPGATESAYNRKGKLINVDDEE